MPPLSLSLNLRRHGRWRKIEAVELTTLRPFVTGERIVVDHELGPEFRGGDPARMAIGVESFVASNPGRLAVEGQASSLVAFSDLLRYADSDAR